MTNELAKTSKNFLWDILSFVAIVLMVGILRHKTFIPFILPFLFLFIFISAFKGRISNLIFTNPFFCVLGGMCYTIYLYHYFIISFWGKLVGNISPIGNYFVTFLIFAIPSCVLIIIASSFLFLLFEKPFMKKEWYRSLVLFKKSVTSQRDVSSFTHNRSIRP